jgi:polyisoprenoid-binding protein YceI
MQRLTLATCLTAAIFAAPVAADWGLDQERSHLSFISIKAGDVAEVHTFKEMNGTIDADGNVKVTLMLDSVDTLVPVRDERMREFLFETTDYKEAVLTAKVDPALVTDMKAGEIKTINAEGNLSLHGADQPMTMLLQAAKVADNTVMVASAKPLVIDAAKFGMTDGVEKLREIAGLSSISKAVPVSFAITFVDGGS